MDGHVAGLWAAFENSKLKLSLRCFLGRDGAEFLGWILNPSRSAMRSEIETARAKNA
jgi:hypothetical protein